MPERPQKLRCKNKNAWMLTNSSDEMGFQPEWALLAVATELLLARLAHVTFLELMTALQHRNHSALLHAMWTDVDLKSSFSSLLLWLDAQCAVLFVAVHWFHAWDFYPALNFQQIVGSSNRFAFQSRVKFGVTDFVLNFSMERNPDWYLILFIKWQCDNYNICLA